jgi:SAM-dependent methyltransferase
VNLLPEEELVWSPIVVNSRMNRERNASGINSYEKEFGFAPQEFLQNKLKQNGRVSWLDLCCGQGKALIQTAAFFQTMGTNEDVQLHGIDLIDTFPSSHKEFRCLSLKAESLSEWNPTLRYDLITCVHGLHYLGDKLAVIRTAITSLTADGLFIANLDLNNFNIDGEPGKTILPQILRLNSIEYNPRTRVLKKECYSAPLINLEYLGADDRYGPNYTGQDSVTSYYRTSG